MPFLKDIKVVENENVYLNGIGLGKWMSEYAPTLSTLQSENSGRKAENGELIVEDIRVDVGSMDISLTRMTRTEYTNIMTILHQRTVNVKFFAGLWYEQQMNVGSDIKSYTKADGNDKWDVQFSLSAI